MLMEAEPTPPFIQVSVPAHFPTVAPVPAPMLPICTGTVEADWQAS
jgi:hypothetical protein